MAQRGVTIRAVLAAGGSAPGSGGVPYEAPHFGASFVAELVGQAAFALPLDSVRYNRRGQEILGVWETRLGARLVARF